MPSYGDHHVSDIRQPHLRFHEAGVVPSDAKRLFHNRARRQLKQLATVLGLAPGAYDLRSNQGGMAVSGEVTLHADRLYVQACQPATGHDTGVLFRTCEGRQDYVGGRNNFASLDLLLQPDEPARRIREACHV